MRIPLLLAAAALLGLPAAAAARPGDVDRSFAAAGSLTLGQPSPSGNEQLEPLSIAVGRAGRIVVGGRQRSGALVTALTRGGARDQRFQPLRDPLLGGLGLEAPGVAALPDGRVIVAATALPAARAGRQTRRLAVYRLRSDGRLDRRFGTRGVAVAGGPGTTVNALVVDRRRRIVVGGTSEQGPVVARFTSRGRLDRDFAGNGVLDGDDRGADRWLQGVIGGAAALPKGRLGLALVRAQGGAGTVANVARITDSGRLDRRFGDRGLARPEIGGLAEGASPTQLAAGPGGTVLAALATAGGAGVTRLRANGERDRRFGNRGETRLGPDATVPNAIVRDRRGRILVGGMDGNRTALLARVRPSGRLDPSFGRRGLVRGHLGRVPRPNRTAFSSVTALALQPDGRILAAGVLGDEAVAGREDLGLVYLTVSRLLP